MVNINRLLNAPYWDEKSLDTLCHRPIGDGIGTSITIISEVQLVSNICETLVAEGIIPLKILAKLNGNTKEELDSPSQKELFNQYVPQCEVQLLYIIHKTLMLKPKPTGTGTMMVLPINFEGFKKYPFHTQVKMARVSDGYLMDRNLKTLVETAKLAKSVSK